MMVILLHFRGLYNSVCSTLNITYSSHHYSNTDILHGQHLPT